MPSPIDNLRKIPESLEKLDIQGEHVIIDPQLSPIPTKNKHHNRNYTLTKTDLENQNSSGTI